MLKFIAMTDEHQPPQLHEGIESPTGMTGGKHLKKFANPKVGETVAIIGRLGCSRGVLVEILPGALARVQWEDIGWPYIPKPLCFYCDLYRYGAGLGYDAERLGRT